MNDEVSNLRQRISLGLIMLLWAHVAVVPAVAYGLDTQILMPSVVTFGLAAVATTIWLRRPLALQTRLVIALMLIASISVLVAICQGTSWQVDLHMYYFAALAMTAAYCDPIVILAAAGLVAFHHLGLNFVASALIFPGGNQLLRVLFHAVILVMEAATLVWMSRCIITLFADRADLTASINAVEKTRALEAEMARQRISAEEDRLASETARAAVQREQEKVMAEMANGLRQLAKGDLTSRLTMPFSERYEDLRADFNTTADSLLIVLRDITAGSASIDSVSGKIARSSSDLARRTEQQAANLEETSSTLNTITESLKSTAVGTTEAASVVAETRGSAEASGGIVSQTVEAMAEIKASSNQIGNIIGVIDEIAFQTNLLALNAGVEAARAGEAGRGFAVVASEVRALAQRSAQAAKEIKTLIASSTVQVEAGVVLVDETGAVLKEIVGKVAAIDRLVQDISSSSRMQATGLAEINLVIRQMDEAVQQNAEMAEDSDSAAADLIRDAKALSAMVGRFKIDAQDDQQAQSPPARNAARVSRPSRVAA